MHSRRPNGSTSGAAALAVQATEQREVLTDVAQDDSFLLILPSKRRERLRTCTVFQFGNQLLTLA
jgi:hypothetical protein